MNEQYDVVIVGGGLVGTTLAIALSKLNIKIALIEAKSIQVPENDTRILGLSFGSRRILNQFGIWSELARDVYPLHSIHVSKKNCFGVTRIHASEMNVDSLGFTIPFTSLQKKLWQQCIATKTEVFFETRVTKFEKQNQNYLLTLDNQKIISAPLVVAADGSRSIIAQTLEIKAQEKNYQQSAIATTVTVNRDLNHVAYERFSDNSVMGLLPLSQFEAAFIWALPQKEAEKMMLLNDEDFLQQVQKQFSDRVGRFVKVSKRLTYPLIAKHLEQVADDGVIFIGNAAHTLHPVAAQGFNLSLRDISVLTRLIEASLKEEFNPYAIALHFQRLRQKDQIQTRESINKLLSIFQSTSSFISALRSIGMTIVDGFLPLKQSITIRSMGLLYEKK